MKQLALDIAAPAAPSLDNFIAGRNAEAIVALYALANGANTESFIYLWGASGCGRTHLLRAVGQRHAAMTCRCSGFMRAGTSTHKHAASSGLQMMCTG
jgi:chromosomal replication initiation ATPase DnaA